MASPSLKKRSSTQEISPPPPKRQFQSTTTKTAVASFFTPASQKPPERVIWSTLHGSVVVGHYRPEGYGEAERRRVKRRKIAAFDLDSTLTTTKSSNRHARDGQDWRFLYPCIPSKLRSLDASGYQLAILSNQGGISLASDPKGPRPDLKRLRDFKERLGAVMQTIDVPCSVYAATGRDGFRKPRPGMWREVCEHYDVDDEVGFDREGSFYVGDAGGRTKDVGTGGTGGSDKDFASSDRDFAANVGVGFQTPEEFFLGEKPRAFERAFEPRVYLAEGRRGRGFEKRSEVDLVVFVGSPGSGKSTYFWTKLEPLGYQRVNQDILKSRDKCLKVATDFLQTGKSVAVDNTNADEEVRAHWIDLARRFKVPARCVLFRTDPKLCEHNEAVRTLNGAIMNPEGRSGLPKLAFAGFAKRYREPSLKEGFEDIIIVEFTFEGTPEQRAVWSQYHV